MRLKRGFSIVEITYVVALVSILVTVGFISWKKMLIRSDSTEAQVNIGLVYVAQKRYFNRCNHYHPNLELIGGIPSGAISYNLGGIPNIGSNPDRFLCLGQDHSCDGTVAGCKSSLDHICADTSDTHARQAACIFKEGTRTNFDTKYTTLKDVLNYKKAIYPTSGTPPSERGFEVSQNYFLISAFKEIDSNIWDVWSIDDLKILTNAKVNDTTP